jgi:hypothetical protein
MTLMRLTGTRRSDVRGPAVQVKPAPVGFGGMRSPVSWIACSDALPKNFPRLAR